MACESEAMGNLLKAVCVCGYTADLVEGSGMAGPEPRYELAHCDRCQEIVSIRSSNVRRRCPQCQGAVSAVVFERRRSIDSAGEPEFEKIQCPRCGKPAALALVGLWD